MGTQRHVEEATPRPGPAGVLLTALLGLAVCLGSGCYRGVRVAEDPPRGPAVDPYVGSRTCAECHAAIARAQRTSNHARTLRAPPRGAPLPGSRRPGRMVDAETGIEYSLVVRGGEHWLLLNQVGRGSEAPRAARLDLLVGSGHHGISPMSRDGSGWRYLAVSYYAAGGWDFSPMHRVAHLRMRREHPQGSPVPLAQARQCFECHSTRIEFQGSEINHERSELGVTCESCHGPGRAHVEAVRSGSGNLAVSNPGRWSGETLLALCQQCHNEKSSLEGLLMGIPDEPDSPSVAKYHVYGLRQSACFRKSGGAFSCLTCHDPHGNAETSPRFYERRCLECHSPPRSAGRSPARARRTVCPVSPRSGCLPCHMPKVQVEQHTRFADHWIRAGSPFVAGGG